jgi:hypothetical protein
MNSTVFMVSAFIALMALIVTTIYYRTAKRKLQLDSYSLIRDYWEAETLLWGRIIKDGLNLENKEDLDRARLAVGKLNKIGYLLQERLLPARHLLSFGAPTISRLTHILEPFIERERSVLQQPNYGCRVQLVRDMAHKYMSCSPSSKANVVWTRPRAEDNAIVFRFDSAKWDSALGRIEAAFRYRFNLY